MNIKLNYLYRDFSNYKQYGSIVFENSKDITLEELTAIIESKLIDGEYFSADEWKIPNFFFETKIDDDHSWHEFQNVEYTNDDAEFGDITTLLNC